MSFREATVDKPSPKIIQAKAAAEAGSGIGEGQRRDRKVRIHQYQAGL